MAKNQGQGRRSAGSAGEYGSYKRASEDRRIYIDDDDDEMYVAEDAPQQEQENEPDDGMDRAAAEAYAQSTASEDDDLSSLTDMEERPLYEDEESMPAPRRRARAYRANQPASELRRVSDEPEDAPQEDGFEDDEPPRAPRPARKPPRTARKPARSASRRELDAGDEDDEPLMSERVRHPAQAQRAPRRDESSHEVDDLEDYEVDDAAYSDDVYEPYEFEDDLDVDEDVEYSATEWSDSIKRVFDRGREGLRALGAKARAGKKRPRVKRAPKRTQKRPAAPERETAQDMGDEDDFNVAAPVQLNIQPLAQQAAQSEQARRPSVDLTEYANVSQELESIEEVRPVSRRERRLSQQPAGDAALQDEFPQVNIVSRKAMRAQQEQDAQSAQPAPQEAQPAQAQPLVEQSAPEQPAPEQPAEQQPDPGQYPAEGGAQPQPEAQGAEDGMMFGIQGRQHIMQPQPDVQAEAQSGLGVEVGWSEPPQDALDEVAEQVEPQAPSADEPARKPNRRTRKSPRKSPRKRLARARNYDMSDDDDDDTQVYTGQQSGADARYGQSAADAYLSDDDDEPEDDGRHAPRATEPRAGAFKTEFTFGQDQYDAFGDSEEGEEDYEEVEDDDLRNRGGCLKAFTVLLVILLVLFGSVWALDYFNVINVRRIVGDITSSSLFDPLRGSLLPEATGVPDATALPEATPEAAAQDAQATPEATEFVMPGVTLVPTMQPADAQAAGLVGTALSQSSIQLDISNIAAAPYDAAVGAIAQIGQPGDSGRGEWSAEQMLRAYSLASTDPDNFDIEYGVYEDYSRADGYVRSESMTFGLGSEYTDLEGVITFRGNNFRENASYGTAELKEKDFEIVWRNRIGSIDSGYAVWSGVGWNGQPVMVHWSDEMRQMMNIRDEYKSDSDLVEVIYGTLDGNIYFLDARTGEYTRDPIELGFPIKGSVSIDPRGYPLLYVGQGISKANGRTGSIGWRVYNLLNQEHMYLLSGHDELRFRTHGSFDGVCLIDAETDTAVVGGENGIFYTIKLNTIFDPATPSISIDPVVTLYRYKSAISDELGYENSVAAYGQYAYLVDNSGLLNCYDLNTMTPVWAFDVGDDTDASIALEPQSDGLIALYTANEVDKQGSSGLSTIRKLDALSGEQLWSFSVDCNSDGTNGGGAFASPAVGKNQLSDLIYFNICRTTGGGTLYAFDKQTGQIVWQQSTHRYSWSSPVIVYDEAGNGVVIVGNSGGTIRMYDGRTGEVLSSIEIEGNMEGSPAVYGDMLVIGTRSCYIYGIRIV